MSQFSQGHALLIGVGTYRHMANADVPVTVRDAQALREVLEDGNYCGYPSEQITLLQEEATTLAGLTAALDNLAASTSAESTVVLYYAGHGEYGTDGNYYLTTHDSQREGAKVAAGTGLSDKVLMEKLRQIPAKRLLLIFNACHAGALSPELSLELSSDAPSHLGINGPPAAALEAILSTGEGRIVMTACRPEQKSQIGHGELTLFAQALVDGLRGRGVANSGGYISAFGLYEHLYATVKEGAADLGRFQEPELTVLRGVGPFPVALFRGATSLGLFDEQAPLPADTAARAVNPERSQRLLNGYITQAVNTGSGAIAQGAGSTAAGERGVAIRGDVSGSPIVTGDNNKVDNSRSVFDQRGQRVRGKQTNIDGDVNTGVGLLNLGRIDTGGGSLTGRDSTARSVNAAELMQVIGPLMQAVMQASSPEQSGEALTRVQAIQAEAQKGEKADDARLAGLVDDLVKLVPGAVTAVVNAFGTPILAGVAGPVTKFVLSRLGVEE
ncbi:MAG: caspase family protein [Caldilineaceae bacterium]|nr:caspase family protein [Caldilineaceae bacterium]